MQQLIEKSRFIALIAVVSLLLASILAFVMGFVKTVQAILKFVATAGYDPLLLVYLIQVLDMFLVATALFVFAVSLYELFIGKLALPDWMVAHNLAELKAKMGSVLVVVMAVTFLEHLIAWQNAQETLFFAIAIAIVSATLIALGGMGKNG